MRKIVIAPDSFKGSLCAIDASQAIRAGIEKYSTQFELIEIPMADGGEGTLDSLISNGRGKYVAVEVKDPLGRSIQASYGVMPEKQLAIIELARASGIELMKQEELNPMVTSTYGTGQLIKHALDAGYRSFIITLGGSATNDGGSGLLQALGMKLLDRNGKSVSCGGQGLAQVTDIDLSSFDPRIKESSFVIAADVQNPFIGERGASHVYGPQKGATPEMVVQLDRAMENWANVIQAQTGVAVHHMEGSGAAGGVGGALLAFCPTVIRRGIQVVMEYTGFYEQVKDASLIITGEGKVDEQTAYGKVIAGIAEVAKQQQIPVIVLAGTVGEGIEQLYSLGVTSIHSVLSEPMTLDEAKQQAATLIEKSSEQLIRLAFMR